MLNMEKRAFIKLLEESLYSTLAHGQLLLFKVLGRELLFIYQMGSVGSRTILNSLRASGFNGLIYHNHFLTEDGLNSLQELEKEAYGDWSKYPANIKRHILQSRFVMRQIREGYLTGRKLKVITLVREPVARNISRFFQDYKFRLRDFRYEHDDKNVSLREIVKYFFEHFPHEATLNWFDRELNSVLGVDVFASQFPRSKAYKIYKGKLADVLLLKTECLDECSQNAFKEFLNIEKFNLSSINKASEKEYSNLYREFKDSIVFPDNYMDRMYNSKYSQHFYSQVEINTFKAKWGHLF